MSEELCEIGVFGLTTAGQSLAAHHAFDKTRVCVGDEDVSFVEQVINEYRTQTETGEDPKELPRASRCMLSSENIEVMTVRLKRPRKIIIFGTHGEDAKFKETWDLLLPRLEKDDIVLRWGKEDEKKDRHVQFYKDSIVGNLSKLEAKPLGIHLLEMVRMERDQILEKEDLPGVFSVGGPYDAYTKLEPYVSPCASIGHVGSEASCAHYARMIQRTIENGVAQALAEGADVMETAAAYTNIDIGRTLNKWVEEGGLLSSYLVRISAKIYYKRDSLTGKGFVLDHIKDSIPLDAVDTWVTLEATKFGIPVPTINAALESRFFSAMKDERVEASSILGGPDGVDTPSVLRDQIGEDLQRAIYCTCICIVAECFAIFQSASEVESWDLNLAGCIEIWNRPGSFMESTLLKRIHSALMDNDGEMKNLLLVPSIASELQELHVSWRRIVTLSFASAVPCPTMSSSLTHYDTYRTRKLPIGVLRAQRNFFDGTRFERTGGDGGWYSTCWITEHTRAKQRKEEFLAAGRDLEPPKKRGKRGKRAIDESP